MTATPTLINLPEPPSNPETPTEAPGTPNSTTTSISALSTIAIKDGHRGSGFPHTGSGHHHTPSTNTLEAERADRISRLAGLERVSTARPSGTNQSAGAAAIPGYFDQAGNPVYTTKISTVGSASATGSLGGRTTTWASGSGKASGDGDGDADERMSVDGVNGVAGGSNFRDLEAENENDRFSTGAMDEDMDDADGMSDNTSLVGFGEGAGSTVSGPTYSRRDLAASPAAGRSALAMQLQRENSGVTSASVERERREARMLDGISDDANDTAAHGVMARGAGGVETAERIMKDRLDESEGNKKAPLGSPDSAGLGKFYFEEKK
ncbi:hypothetical protein HYALB_00005389 [Hymenoscyphus albidus]|uniref:Uncharacterized protein n=1 Tax=Hymenoscyphus albidus TaxID=595503 RepID=A0A9N9LC88_9HELO|nr:hypothetical protein HYALB_00005389 [Hymenoscyphus albidus]